MTTPQERVRTLMDNSGGDPHPLDIEDEIRRAMQESRGLMKEHIRGMAKTLFGQKKNKRVLDSIEMLLEKC